MNEGEERGTNGQRHDCRGEKEADFNPLSTQSPFQEGELIIANREVSALTTLLYSRKFPPSEAMLSSSLQKGALPSKAWTRLSESTSLLRSRVNPGNLIWYFGEVLVIVSPNRKKNISHPFVKGTTSRVTQPSHGFSSRSAPSSMQLVYCSYYVYIMSCHLGSYQD